MIRVAGSVSKGWLAAETGAVFDRAYYFDVDKRHATDMRCNEYVQETLGDLDVFYTESNLGRREWYTPQQVLVGGIQPNMIVGMLLGAEFLPDSKADADISPHCLAGRVVRSLPEPSGLLEHPLVLHWQEQLTRLQSRETNARQPIPPFFWDQSGRAAVHGAVTSGLKFFGDGFSMDLLADPDATQNAILWLTQVSAVLVAHFSTVGHMQVRDIHVGECAACMIDRASFERFVVPATSLLGERFGAVRFHTCGRSDHIIGSCQQIAGLASLDVGGETSLAVIREVFGDELSVSIAPLVDDMRAASSRGILDWFQRVERENRQGELTIGFHLERDYRIENIRALQQAVQRSAE